jgi:hypothetical protein
LSKNSVRWVTGEERNKIRSNEKVQKENIERKEESIEPTISKGRGILQLKGGS